MNGDQKESGQENDELLMVFEITRHGARTGLHSDFFNTTWIPGELTGVGMRQHYLIGQQMRQKYVVDQNYLSESYNPLEIFVRSTDVNRTIQSASAQLLGMYPPETNQFRLMDNQTDNALPPFNISEDILAKTQKELGNFALPFNYQQIPIHVYDENYDLFQPLLVCPLIQQVRIQRKSSQEHIDFMNQNFNDTIYKVAQAMHADPMEFSSLNVTDYGDSLWARYFDQIIEPGFDIELLSNMMKLYSEYYNYTLAMNETTRKAFVTGMLTELASIFIKTIELDQKGELFDNDRLKLFFYSDHDDSTVSLCDAFEYSLPNYPPFASQIVFELRKRDRQYYVNMTVNDMIVPLKGHCQNKSSCEIAQFVELLKDISFYDSKDQYVEICETQKLYELQKQYSYWNNNHQVFHEGVQSQSQQKPLKDYSRVFYLYAIMIMIALLSWVYYERRKQQMGQTYNQVE